MANIIQNIAELSRIRDELDRQLDTVTARLRGSTVVLDGVHTKIEAGRSGYDIVFTVNFADAMLECHYDSTLDEFYIDESNLAASFGQLRDILLGVEAHVRSILRSVE